MTSHKVELCSFIFLIILDWHRHRRPDNSKQVSPVSWLVQIKVYTSLLVTSVSSRAALHVITALQVQSSPDSLCYLRRNMNNTFQLL